jgi:uncharacterized membrane protein
MRNKFYKFVVVLIGLWLMKPMLAPGLPVSHDGQNHLGRMANYYLAAKEGQLPPRWAPNLNAGFGYPVLNFNYPLANILGVPLIAVNFGIENTYKLIVLSGYVLGGLGMYAFLRRRFKDTSALFGALLYLTTPYQMMNIVVRGNIGETLSLALLPWILHYMDKVTGEKKLINEVFLTVALTAMWLSHNLMVLLSLPIIGFYGLVILKNGGIKKLVAPLVLSLTLVAFFWLPAVGEMNSTIMSSSSLNREYVDHFATPSELLFSPLNFGFSEPGPVDGITLNIGMLSWLVVILGVLVVLKDKRFSKLWVLFLSLFIFAILMMLPISKQVWSLIPFSGFIQFPWRLLFITVICSAVLGASLFDRIKLKWPLMILLVGYMVGTARADLVRERFSGDDLYWMSYPLTTTVIHENDPQDYDRSASFNYFSSQDKVMVYDGEAEVLTISNWNGSLHNFALNVIEDSTIIERTVYFPGWKVYANGETVELKIDKDSTFGLISYRLPKGEYEIETKFTQQTIWRVIGNGLSIFGLVIFLYRIFVVVKSKNES